MSEHNEPWEYNDAHEIGDCDGYYVGSSRQYRKRIVSAVNACAGIPTEALEAGVVKEMVEALNKASDNANYKGEKAIIPLDDLFRIREVLAKLGIKE